MVGLQRTVENIAYFDERFPRKELNLISANRDQAVPYLRDAVVKAIVEKEDLDEDYMLHLYGMFLLAQFQDREFFPRMMELACLPERTLDHLIGDVFTEDLGNILYNMYNGDIDLIKRTVMNKAVSDFARSQMLNVIGQLYRDHTIKQQDIEEFLRGIVHSKEIIGDYIYSAVVRFIYNCHLTNLLPELRLLYTNKLVDIQAVGGYDRCVDSMFSYERERKFCKSPINAVKDLRRLEAFEYICMDIDEEDHVPVVSPANILDELGGGAGNAEQRGGVRIDRNDPCPCGSDKNSCLEGFESEESRLDQEKYLRSYPKTDTKRIEGRVYLEDLYSSESIALDKLLYVGLKYQIKPNERWKPDPRDVERKRRYLINAYHKFKELAERENIENFAEFDDRYAIHYMCEEWFEELIKILEKGGSEEVLRDVCNTYKKMGTQ